MTQDGKKVIMAIGGHIGDAELTCGGVLATASLRGDHIVTVALTGGERGNPPHMTVEEYRKQKIQEAETFEKCWAAKRWCSPTSTESFPRTTR